MSLVVCRKLDQSLIVVSDTKLSNLKHILSETISDNLRRNLMNLDTGNPVDGTIKTVILSKQTCISFAGVIQNAEEAFRTIKPTDQLPKIIEILKVSSASNETEFLLCSLHPTKIYKINKGICSEQNNSWIGSQKAFSKFQGYLHKQIKPIITGSHIKIEMVPPDEPNPSIFGEVSLAFDNVILDPEIKDVGGFKVMVQNLGGFFQYKGYNLGYEGVDTIQIPRFKPGLYMRPMFQKSASSGSYNINFLIQLKTILLWGFILVREVLGLFMSVMKEVYLGLKFIKWMKLTSWIIRNQHIIFVHQ
jgi:hypothetical protein